MNNRIKQVLLQLLTEMKDICNENNIEYSLYGSTAAKILTTGTIDEPFARIMVRNQDFVKLCNIMEKRHIKGRSFDCMDNNPDYMDYTARYSNSETTFIPLGYKGNVFKSGIYVEIVPLRVENHSKKTHRQLRFLEHGWEKHFCNMINYPSYKYILTVFPVNILKLFAGKKRISKWIFKKMAESHSGPFVSSCTIKCFNRTLAEFSFDPFKKIQEVTFEGETFAVSSNISNVLRKVYSRVWQKRALTPYNMGANIVLLNVSCKQFVRSMNKTNLWKKHFRKKSRQMFRTGARARLYFYYRPKMELIRNLVEKQDYYRLSSIMSNNRMATLLAYKDGTGFAVNKELFDIQMMLFRFEGNEELANRLEEITPKYYMKSIIEHADED